MSEAWGDILNQSVPVVSATQVPEVTPQTDARLFLASLRNRGIRITVDWTVRPPASKVSGLLTADDKAQLALYREGILDLLWHEIPAQCEPGSEWGRPWPQHHLKPKEAS